MPYHTVTTESGRAQTGEPENGHTGERLVIACVYSILVSCV
jgi:hypothetical protein